VERRYTNQTVTLETRSDGKLPVITGLASVFYSPDDDGTEFELFNDDPGDGTGYRCVERIMPTAFDEVLRRGDDVMATHNHNPDRLLGRVANGTLELQKTPDGLRYRITPPDCEMARDVIASIQRGDLRGSSFSFDCRGNGCRFVRQGKLTVREVLSVAKCGDVGPVASPAYASTTTGIRSAADYAEARQAFDEWIKTGRMSPAQRDAMKARMRLVQLGL
jgi:HK97 family phage prohead protease